MVKLIYILEACQSCLEGFTYKGVSFFTKVDAWKPNQGFTADFISLCPFAGVAPPSGVSPDNLSATLERGEWQLTFFIFDKYPEDGTSGDENVKESMRVIDALAEYLEKNLPLYLSTAYFEGFKMSVTPILCETNAEDLVFNPDKDTDIADRLWACILGFKLTGKSKIAKNT